MAADDRYGDVSDDLGDLVEELFTDASKLKRILQRAFPGSEQLTEAEVAERQDRFRKADAEPGLERAHVDGQLSESEKAAAECQEAARGKHTLY